MAFTADGKKVTVITMTVPVSAEPKGFTPQENPFPVLSIGTTYDIWASKTTKFTYRICFL